MDTYPPKPAPSAGNIHRFIISGATGTAIHFLILIVCKEALGIGVIVSTTIAFAVAFTASFSLQKTWTFQNYDVNAIPHQAIRYLAVALLNVGINAVLMYVFSDWLSIHYLVAQLITSSFIAVESYVLYRRIVFKPVLHEKKEL